MKQSGFKSEASKILEIQDRNQYLHIAVLQIFWKKWAI